MSLTRTYFLVPTLLLTALASACSGNDPDSSNVAVQAFGLSIEPQTSGQLATPMAEVLWEQISGANDYKAWDLWPGSLERQASNAPHGELATVRYRANDANALTTGDILVKENLVGGQDEPQALTVMLKLEGFDGANANWFYAKFLPDGTIDTNPSGTPLAGAMEPARGAGCRGCHRGAPGDDFVWL